MPKIKILSDIVANKIAAGEVVERPASVVKELLENAIDACADSITVEVESGGRRLVRVSDNGVGMSRDDALLSLERHATSKIEKISDIENIVTLGFRGEALPSIVSVSKVVIDTKTKDDVFGTRLVIHGGILKNVTDIGRDEGTDVEVKNIFFNMPARRKFLKSESTELKHIKRILYDTAVSTPGLSLILISEGKQVFAFRECSDRIEMLRQIFGDTFSSLMVPINLKLDGIEIEGFFGKPETASSTFNQYIIVNGRPVKSRSILRAVLSAYGSRLVKGMYPAFVLYFDVDPARIDVNIHPAKSEIRIHREFMIIQGLRDAVAQIFQTMEGAPELGDIRKPFMDFKSTETPITVYNPPDEKWYSDIKRGERSSHRPDFENSQTGFSFPAETGQAQKTESTAGAEAFKPQFEGPVFMQLNDMYIITTIKEGAIILDQHVAHERILYEEIVENLRGKPTTAQQLLFTLTLDFSAADYDILEPMLPFLNKIGFGIREFGERSVIVDAIPAGMTGFEDGRILYEFIEEMRVHGKITSGYMEKLAAALACRSAIKAGKPLSQSEMQYLVDKLFATKSPFVCPHGRPTIVKLTVEELNRRFGR